MVFCLITDPQQWSKPATHGLTSLNCECWITLFLLLFFRYLSYQQKCNTTGHKHTLFVFSPCFCSLSFQLPPFCIASSLPWIKTNLCYTLLKTGAKVNFKRMISLVTAKAEVGIPHLQLFQEILYITSGNVQYMYIQIFRRLDMVDVIKGKL